VRHRMPKEGEMLGIGAPWVPAKKSETFGMISYQKSR
jgi:hypothetical protein